MRGLSKPFLEAMRQGLEHGRQKGHTGWDKHWDCYVYRSLSGVDGELMSRLYKEVAELVIAVHEGNPETIKLEAADVANFAMFIADIEGAFQLEKLVGEVAEKSTVRGGPCPKGGNHDWGIDGMHSNQFCKKCFGSHPYYSKR